MFFIKQFLKKTDYTSVKLTTVKSEHILVRAEINGVSARLIVDTGASFTCIDRDAVEKLKLNQDHSEYRATGAGAADLWTGKSMIKQLRIGKWSCSNKEILIMDLTHVRKALLEVGVKKVYGVLGADVLKSSEAIIHYGEKRLLLK